MSFDQVNIGTKEAPLMVTKHPIIHTPSRDDLIELAREIGPDGVVEVLKRREEKIKAEVADPYRHGYEPDHWREADGLLMEGTSSS